MAEYTLENWSVYADPYKAPEVGAIRLHGTRSGHELPVLTNYVDRVDGRRVTTLSGSVYVLGEPSAKYRQWMAENGIAYDPEHPVRIRRRG
jgi:hypothetical protein